MNKLICFVFVSISMVPLIASYMVNRKYRKKLKLLSEEDSNFYHQLLAVDMKNFNCRPHLIDRKECSEWCSLAYLNTLLKFISSAKCSICICMYMLTLKSVNYELIQAHKRGVIVRVIADKVMLQTKPEQDNFSRLSQNGIPYKLQPLEESMMHHKFCLIDKNEKEHAKMFFGSLNLTTQGLCSNFDNVVLTNNVHIIERFSEEFDELWNLF